jgi:hypothetical protein
LRSKPALAVDFGDCGDSCRAHLGGWSNPSPASSLDRAIVGTASEMRGF